MFLLRYKSLIHHDYDLCESCAAVSSLRDVLMVVEPQPMQSTQRTASNMSICPAHGAVAMPVANARPPQGLQLISPRAPSRSPIQSRSGTPMLQQSRSGSPMPLLQQLQSVSPMPQQGRRQPTACLPSPARRELTPYRPPQGRSTGRPEYMLMELTRGDPENTYVEKAVLNTVASHDGNAGGVYSSFKIKKIQKIW